MRNLSESGNGSKHLRKMLPLAGLSIFFAQALYGSASGAAITTAMGVRNLTPAEARKERPVRIHAVVTYVNAASNELFVQDATAGIFVFIRDSAADVPLETGQSVEIAGVSAPGDFCASITKARITVVGRAPVPMPVRLPYEYLLTGKEDCQWGELKAVVRSGRVSEDILYLNAMTSGGPVLVIMENFPLNWHASLIDARITFDGVLAAVFNEHRQVSGVRMFIPGKSFFTVDDPPPASAFDLPLSSALSIGAFRTSGDWGRRERVRATVTAVVSNSLLYAAQESGSLPAQLDSSCSAQPGDLLDIVGFPGLIDSHPGLQNSACRVIEHDRDVVPLPLKVRDILPSDIQEIGSGLSIAAGTRYDLKLVTVEGSLVQAARGLHSQTLTLSSADRNFTVTVPDAFKDLGETLELGSTLQVTGVCVISFDEFRRPQSFRLLIRRNADIGVKTRPPWWNIRRALWVIVAMLVAVCGALAWVSVLRKHVAIKTNQLREANECLHRIAVEDALTGAANRRRFDEMIAIEVSRSSRASRPLSLIMADVDYFKSVNDIYGHQTGDQCLLKVAQALKRSAPRMTDLVCRYGGEEFAVILPDTGDDEAGALAESMRRSVEFLAIPSSASPLNQRLSISLGVATLWPGSTYSADDLIGMADRALYHAKQKGRNRVISSGALTLSV